MFPPLTLGTTRTVLLGLGACLILFGGSSLVGEARPLNQTAPTLGTASSFAVLGGSTVTNTGATVVNADLGLSPGTAVTGFPPGTVVNGTIHAADGVALQAQTDTTTAYNTLAGESCPGGNNLTGQDLGGKTLPPGVYCFPNTSAQLTGVLTLNALGNSASVFVFQIGSTLTTAPGASVVVINPGTGAECNVFWQVGSSATLGTTTRLLGTIIALTSITLNTGANLNGRALARNGAVTLDTNTLGFAGCATGLPTAVPTATLAPPAATAAASTATSVAASTAAAIPTATPPPSSSSSSSSRPTATRTPTVPPTTTPTTTPTAIPTLLPATPTAAIAATSVAVAAAVAAAPAAAAPAPAAPTAALAVSVPTPTAEVVAPTETVSIPVAALAPPAALPRTGGGAGIPPLGLVSLLVGGLAVAAGLTVRRTRK